MISERRQAMMRSVGSRATMANLLRDGFVLGNYEVCRIRSAFGMSTQNAGLWDMKLEIECGDFEKRTTVPAEKSEFLTPVVYFDTRRYASAQEAQDWYMDHQKELGLVLQDMGFRW